MAPESDVRKSRLPDHRGDLVGRRENADGFDEVPVGPARAADQPGDERHDPERIEMIERPDPWPGRQREFQDKDPAPGLEDPRDLGQPPRGVDEIPEAKPERDRVHRPPRQGDPFRLALEKTDGFRGPRPGDPAPSRRHHGAVEIVDDDPPAGPHLPGREDGQPTGPATEIKDRLARPEPQAGYRLPPPTGIQAGAQDSVGQVVLPGDLVELPANKPPLFFGGHIPVTERHSVSAH
jgi:hypothetical protein